MLKESEVLKIREIRNQKKMSQEDLAKKIGVRQGYISDLETGRKVNPSTEILGKIAEVFCCKVGELFKA